MSCTLLSGLTLVARGQTRLPAVDSAPALPEPIYWKQDLFLVPYQWGSAAEAGAAQSVWLFVSKDLGATWQKISEARPNVTSFNYRAAADGEYWFAVRTIDAYGRAWPSGAYRPELRVIVDTVIPQITAVSAQRLESGAIEVAWRGSDANLDPTTWRFEAQVDAAGTWQPAAIETGTTAPPIAIGGPQPAVHAGQALWTPPPGIQPLAIRATVSDRAGNPATYQAPVASQPTAGYAAVGVQMPLPSAAAPTAAPSPPAGWISSSAAASQAASPPSPQTWQPEVTHRAPFRLFSSGPTLPDDGITAYGNPPTIAAPQIAANAYDSGPARLEARYAMNSGQDASAVLRGSTYPEPGATQSTDSGPSYSPLEPFRQASIGRPLDLSRIEPSLAQSSTADRNAPLHQPPAQPKLVGSRSFALEYDLDDLGRWGVTKVELWGTRDGGRAWQRYARDDDHRSPLLVTVDDEGVYGFRIVMESAGAIAQPPAAGDEPELWVAVDLHRPTIELTAIERGQGNQADHLILRWAATDDNLESRPISLYYSSLPAGPWSAIATNLQDTGEYAWRVERHVPTRFYLRAEARDTAGNLAAFQTREPIDLPRSDPTAHLQTAEPLGTTAAGAEAGYR